MITGGGGGGGSWTNKSVTTRHQLRGCTWPCHIWCIQINVMSYHVSTLHILHHQHAYLVLGLGGGGLPILLSSIVGQDAHTIGNRANEHSWGLSLSLSLSPSSDLHSTRPGKSPWTTCRGSLQLVKHIMCVLHHCIPQNKAIKVYNVMHIMCSGEKMEACIQV